MNNSNPQGSETDFIAPSELADNQRSHVYASMDESGLNIDFFKDEAGGELFATVPFKNVDGTILQNIGQKAMEASIRGENPTTARLEMQIFFDPRARMIRADDLVFNRPSARQNVTAQTFFDGREGEEVDFFAAMRAEMRTRGGGIGQAGNTQDDWSLVGQAFSARQSFEHDDFFDAMHRPDGGYLAGNSLNR